MKPIEPGARAPQVPGVTLPEGKGVVLFYKTTCPTCQLAAPAAERLSGFAGERFLAVVQDPPERVAGFARDYGVSFPSVTDDPPYDTSNAYGLRTVPTLYLLRDGVVSEVVESWDRDGWNRVATELGGEPVSQEGDGLPSFRPG